MLYLSGMRVGAMGTLPIEAVDLAERSVRQWPSLGVYTKNGKAATTYLLPIPELLEVVQRWDGHVRETLPPTAMWCPPVGHTWGDQSLTADRPGANRHIAINKRLRLLFSLADLPPQSPHKFRHGHAVWALQHARTMADYKAISQNLMHSDIRVTDGIYAPLLGNEVQQRVAGLASQASHPLPTDGDLVSFLSRLSKAEIPAVLHVLADRLAQ
jgi:integrase